MSVYNEWQTKANFFCIKWIYPQIFIESTFMIDKGGGYVSKYYLKNVHPLTQKESFEK